VKPIDYGPLHGFLSLADGVWFPIAVGLGAVGLGIMAVWKRGVISEPTRDVFFSLLMAVIGPFTIVTGSGHYILQAGTGYFQVPSDFRNSQEWVYGLYWFMAIASPLWAGLCLIGTVEALLRRRRLRHATVQPADAALTDDHPKHHHKKRRRTEAD
jgi:hypothetical protein